jgi:hypothetical protein
MSIRPKLINLLKCKHNKGFGYFFSGGQRCSYDQCNCERECSLPVYEIYCKKCGEAWTVGTDELIDFFAQKVWTKVKLKENPEDY